MITYANYNLRFMFMLFCHMYFNTLILRKTTSSVTKDPCHLERNFTAVKGKRGSWRKPRTNGEFMGHNSGNTQGLLNNSPTLQLFQKKGKHFILGCLGIITAS